jgi:putative SOS response-associated peptidase YedK
MFREAAKNGRCLIPADAFFEWGDGEKAPKAEHRFSAPDGRPFWLGGLWGRSEPEEGPIISFTMVTKPCGADTASVGHDRQPVNLAGEQLAAWMDPANPVASFLGLSPAGTFTVNVARAGALRRCPAALRRLPRRQVITVYSRGPKQRVAGRVRALEMTP